MQDPIAYKELKDQIQKFSKEDKTVCLEEIFTCQICFMQYNDGAKCNQPESDIAYFNQMNSRRPHLIPCGHTLCLKCLTQLASQSRKDPKSIFCPFDKAEHKFTENVSKAFPVNFAILKGLEAFN